LLKGDGATPFGATGGLLLERGEQEPCVGRVGSPYGDLLLKVPCDGDRQVRRELSEVPTGAWVVEGS
jgi:hypothetical protein